MSEVINLFAPPPLMSHQSTSLEKMSTTQVFFDMSDPGTGKTRVQLEAFAERRRDGGGRMLVLAPKSILQPAWGDDIDKWTPDLTYMVATANNRKRAFNTPADIYITNHDAVKYIDTNWKDLRKLGFDTLVVDEATAFKNPNSQRSKSLVKLAQHFTYRSLLTGTPNPNTVLELWNPAFILDRGERLGASYWKFRNAVCEPVQVGPSTQHIKWQDKKGAEIAVFDLLEDISIRHKFEDCVDIPPNYTHTVFFNLPPKIEQKYREMEDWALTEVNGKTITSLHAGSLRQKLLQMASGAIYHREDTETNFEIFDDTRTELIMDLIEERDQVVVASIWRHQREQLVAAAEKRGFSVGYIDGTVNNVNKRTELANAFQAGNLKVLICHPQSAGHGLTLTKGTTTIWASPTYNSEHYKQLFHRIYRTGQTKKTETIHVVARNTVDELVYDRLDGKLTAMQLLLDLMEQAA